MAAEIAIILLMSGVLTALLLALVAHYDEPLVRALFVR